MNRLDADNNLIIIQTIFYSDDVIIDQFSSSDDYLIDVTKSAAKVRPGRGWATMVRRLTKGIKHKYMATLCAGI